MQVTLQSATLHSVPTTEIQARHFVWLACPRRRGPRHTQRPLKWEHNTASQENTRHHTVGLPYTLLHVCLCIKLQWQGRDKGQCCSARASSHTTIHTRTLFTRLRSKRICWRLCVAQCHYQGGSGQASGQTRCCTQTTAASSGSRSKHFVRFSFFLTVQTTPAESQSRIMVSLSLFGFERSVNIAQKDFTSSVM